MNTSTLNSIQVQESFNKWKKDPKYVDEIENTLMKYIVSNWDHDFWIPKQALETPNNFNQSDLWFEPNLRLEAQHDWCTANQEAPHNVTMDDSWFFTWIMDRRMNHINLVSRIEIHKRFAIRFISDSDRKIIFNYHTFANRSRCRSLRPHRNCMSYYQVLELAKEEVNYPEGAVFPSDMDLLASVSNMGGMISLTANSLYRS